jgi:hypothetical protein
LLLLLLLLFVRVCILAAIEKEDEEEADWEGGERRGRSLIIFVMLLFLCGSIGGLFLALPARSYSLSLILLLSTRLTAGTFPSSMNMNMTDASL